MEYIRVSNSSFNDDALALLHYRRISLFISQMEVQIVIRIISSYIGRKIDSKFTVKYDGPCPKSRDRHLFSLIFNQEAKNKDLKGLLGGEDL